MIISQRLFADLRAPSFAQSTKKHKPLFILADSVRYWENNKSDLRHLLELVMSLYKVIAVYNDVHKTRLYC